MSCKCCTSGGGGGGGGGAAVIGLVLVGILVLIGAAVVKTVIRAAELAGRVLAVVVEVVLIALGVGAALAVVAVLGWAGIRVYRWHRARVRSKPLRLTQVRAEAIDPPGLHLTAVPVCPGGRDESRTVQLSISPSRTQH